MSQEQDGPPVVLNLPEEHAGGVWSNFALVSHSPYEFTIDFVRLDFARKGEEGLPGSVVSRVNLSPLMVSQLIDALNDNWQKYAERAMPKEVRDVGGDHQD